MKRCLAIAALVFLASTLSFATAFAAEKATDKSADLALRPWNGVWSGTMQIVGYCDDGALRILDSGKGFATLMGASEWVATICLNSVTGIGTGSAVITGANGDAVYLAITLQSIGLGGSEGTWIETETVTGGTGRFTDAAGSGSSNGTWRATSATSFSWVGTSEAKISY